MKKRIVLALLLLTAMIAGCTENTIQSDKEAGTEAPQASGKMQDMAESYPWRKAYAEFLRDYEALRQKLYQQIETWDYFPEVYTTKFSFIYLNNDDIPELLVTFHYDAISYFLIYHYTQDGQIELWLGQHLYSHGGSLRYLQKGNVLFTSYERTMGGFWGYELYYLNEENDWCRWDSLPYAVSKAVAERYGVHDHEQFAGHDDTCGPPYEPKLSDEWKTPELTELTAVADEYSLQEMLGYDVFTDELENSASPDTVQVVTGLSTDEKLLAQTYSWRMAYMNLMYDRAAFQAGLNAALASYTPPCSETEYDVHIGLLFLDDNESPELLAEFTDKGGFGPAYYIVYHYDESENRIVQWFWNRIDLNPNVLQYRPHGGTLFWSYDEGRYDLYLYQNNNYWNVYDTQMIYPKILQEQIWQKYGISENGVTPVLDNDLMNPSGTAWPSWEQCMVETFGQDAVPVQ